MCVYIYLYGTVFHDSEGLCKGVRTDIDVRLECFKRPKPFEIACFPSFLRCFQPFWSLRRSKRYGLTAEEELDTEQKLPVCTHFSACGSSSFNRFSAVFERVFDGVLGFFLPLFMCFSVF